MADGPGLNPLDAAGQCGSDDVPRGSGQSAPVVVVPMMTVVEVPAVVTMMTPPMRIGIQHLRAERRGRDHRRLRRLVGCRERGRGKDGNGKHRRGDCLEHLVVLQGDREVPVPGSLIM